MRTHCLLKYCTVLLFAFAVISLGGCKNFIKPELGAIAQKDARIELDNGEINDGLLKTKQLQLTYNLTTTDDQFTIKGTLVIDRSVYSSFPIAKRFFLKVNFLDAEGRVLSTSDISPLFSTSSYISETLAVSRSGMRPPGSTAIAFNYFGTFGAENFEEKGDKWEVFYFPFD